MSMRIPVLLLAGLLAPVAGAAEAAGLREFHASYAVTWRGLSAGRSELELSRLPDGRWSYVSRSLAQGIFRVALSTELSQRSTFTIRDDRIEPERFQIDDGTTSKRRDQDLRFDWKNGRVTGVADEMPVDLALEPGVLDGMTLQIAMMRMLLAGQVPDRFLMIDKTRIKDYVYTQEGAETLPTPLGPQQTVVFRSSRPGGVRGTWFWCAPELGYLPVKVERRNGTKVEWSLTLLSARIGAGE